MSRGRLAIVLSGFPRRSETFALNELLALEDRGLLGKIFATKPGDGEGAQPGCERLMARVEVLPAGNPAEQAGALAGRLSATAVAGIHAYFAHTPAEVAAGGARALGVPYGFSVHARDARKVRSDELMRRGRGAACVVACNADIAGELRQRGVETHLVPHGVDLDRFRPVPLPPDRPLRLLAVGRLVPKKGFDVLLDAVARLSIPFQLRIVGDGPERDRLAALAGTLELGERIVFHGGVTHAALPSLYAEAHVVVAPSVEDSSGDRDGLPNVVLEAMACGRAVVASDVGAIRTAVTVERTGWLVPPGDAVALGNALAVVADPRRLAALGGAGRARVERDFELGRCTERLHDLLVSAYA